MRSRKTPPTSIDDYLSDLTRDQRAALNALRKSIAKAAPRAVESIRYQLPAFDFDGRALVSFGVTKTHCTFERLPDSLVDALVKTRIAEIDAAKAKPKRSASK
jgi:uncharacterized protein YdhG (YjbR/CyaY superfamily)